MTALSSRSSRIATRRQSSTSKIWTSATGISASSTSSTVAPRIREQRPMAALCMILRLQLTKRMREGALDIRLRYDLGQVDAEMDDRLRDLRPDAADDAVRAPEADGGRRLPHVRGHHRVDGPPAPDIDQGADGRPTGGE